MAEERSDETRVGQQVVGEEERSQETAIHATKPEAEGEPKSASDYTPEDEAQKAAAAPTPPPPRSDWSGGGASPAAADRIVSDQEDPFAEKPHLYALGAFAGAFVLAQVLKKLTEGD